METLEAPQVISLTNIQPHNSGAKLPRKTNGYSKQSFVNSSDDTELIEIVNNQLPSANWAKKLEILNMISDLAIQHAN